ncbi:MBOAT family O-acyltransferase [Mucilaginibacter psychrotolerans]|uniref:MBOAT family O-acyltransferase n=1 Tax=Mucilaginibacter psychrotolerans TaxID=1524096 RepID=UPI0019570BF4|nr:MBOAT family protein [Mucilaginibacter psychrotolerans]
MLIIASLVFYAYNQPILVLLLLLSVSINIISSYLVVYGKIRYRKHAAIAGVVLNLAILIFFKYSALIYTTITDGSDSFGQFIVSIPLPIGISFFTFQGISLIVDVYSRKYVLGEDIVPVSFVKHAERILFFKGFFPQLISGPIVKAHDFLPQIGVKKIADIAWEPIFKKLVVGYFFKMVVADNLSNFTFWMTNPSFFIGSSSIKLITLLFGFSCQIFADFAGYSLIAIGLARLFGYTFPDNFNFPYISTSFKDFWKRWNISLSSFLMEYLYIPLGGNKRGKLRMYINLMIVMILGGLWHGAAWSYAVWGLMHGLALVVERMLSGKTHRPQGIWIITLKRCLVFSFVTLAWLLFQLPKFEYVLVYLNSLLHNTTLVIDPDIVHIALYSSPVFLYHLLYVNRTNTIFQTIKKYDFVVYAILIFCIVLNSGPVSPFIYFQF